MDELIKLIDLKEVTEILDIGCGKGKFLRHLTEHINANFTGVDLSPYFISDARESFKIGT